MSADVMHAVLGIALVSGAAVAAALLLRWARCPGWGVVGGAAAGLFVGASVLGHVLPQTYEQLFLGGQEQRMHVQHLRALQVHQIAQQRPADAPDQDAIASALQELDAAEHAFEAPQRSAVFVLVALLMLGGASGPRGAKDERQSLLAALSIGLGASLIPAVIVFAIGRQWLDLSLTAALFVAAAIAVGAWRMTESDRAAADAVELGGARLMQNAARISIILGIAVVAGAIAVHVLESGQSLMRSPDWLWLLPLLAAPLGWMSPKRIWGGAIGRAYDAAARFVVVPAFAGMIALHIDLLADLAIWLTLLVALLTGDGRWVGGCIGAKITGGRIFVRVLRLVIGVMACGPTQLALTALALYAFDLPKGAALALLAGAVLVEVTTPTRRRVVETLTQAEEEVEI